MAPSQNKKTNDANLQNDDPKSPDSPSKEGSERRRRAARGAAQAKEKGHCLKGRSGFAVGKGRRAEKLDRKSVV